MDQLEQLALVHNGAEGAVHQAHAAVDALVIVDLGPAVLVLADGVHAAGLLAGPEELDDGLIGAGGLALAALDALGLVDLSLAVLKVDGPLGTGMGAVPGQAALAGVGDLIVGVGTGVAGVFDDVDQRRIVVFLGNGAFLHTVGQQRMLGHIPQGKAHGQADPLAHNGPLQEDGLPDGAHLAGHQLIGQLLQPGIIVPALIGQLRHLGEHLLAHVGDGAL